MNFVAGAILSDRFLSLDLNRKMKFVRCHPCAFRILYNSLLQSFAFCRLVTLVSLFFASQGCIAHWDEVDLARFSQRDEELPIQDITELDHITSPHHQPHRVTSHHIKSHHHLTSPHLATSHFYITSPHITNSHIASSIQPSNQPHHIISPAPTHQGHRTSHHHNTSRWIRLVALCTFYTQVLSLDSRFFSPEISAPGSAGNYWYR